MKINDKLIERVKQLKEVAINNQHGWQFPNEHYIEATGMVLSLDEVLKILESEQTEEGETFRKVYIKSAEDLPKEDGDYIVKYNDGSIETFPFKLDEAHWFTHIDWYLLPVSSLQSSEPEKVTDEEIGQMANEQVSLYLKARNNPTQDLYKRFVNMAKWALKHSETIK